MGEQSTGGPASSAAARRRLTHRLPGRLTLQNTNRKSWLASLPGRFVSVAHQLRAAAAAAGALGCARDVTGRRRL